jgi:hypothetical protein
MSASQKAFTFRYYVLCFVISALSGLILGVILFWTLEHTDIVAFVTVLLAATVLEAFLVFSLFKATPVPENTIGDQRADSRKLTTPILASIEKLGFLIGAGTEKYPQ